MRDEGRCSPNVIKDNTQDCKQESMFNYEAIITLLTVSFETSQLRQLVRELNGILTKVIPDSAPPWDIAVSIIEHTRKQCQTEIVLRFCEEHNPNQYHKALMFLTNSLESSVDIDGTTIVKIKGKADIRGCYLVNSNLDRLIIVNSSARGMKWSGVLFQGSVFNGCNMEGLVFKGVDFTNATFENCTFDKANFTKSDITKARGVTRKLKGVLSGKLEALYKDEQDNEVKE